MSLLTLTKEKAVAIICILKRTLFSRIFSLYLAKVYPILQYNAFEIKGSYALLS